MRKHTLLLLCLLSPAALAIADDEPAPVRVVVWDERQKTEIKPYGGFLGDYLAAELAKRPGITTRSVGIDDPEQGLSDEILDNADVLIWWGHIRHKEITTETARRILKRVRQGKLSLVVLHSALSSRPFIEAMHQRSRLDAALALADVDATALHIQLIDPGPEVVRPEGSGPITPSLESKRTAPAASSKSSSPFPPARSAVGARTPSPATSPCCGPTTPSPPASPPPSTSHTPKCTTNPSRSPTPDVVIFHERWDAGEQFRAGCLWNLGKGKVFYFRPGHETDDVFKHPEPMLVLENAARFLAHQQTLNR